MKISSRSSLLVSSLFAVSLLSACGGGQEPGAAMTAADPAAEHTQSVSSGATPLPEQAQQSSVGMPNPASEYCIKLDGTLDFVQGEAGEIAMCHLPDGTVIEEWELFRRDNAPHGSPTAD